jgi:V8-like Glu-specific endopeptidase
MRCATVLRLSSCLILWSSLAVGQGFTSAQINEKYSTSIVLIKTDAGTGTGFIVSPDGVIATAFHVVANAKKMGIKTASGDIFEQVLLLAKDERKDVAVLKIAGYNLPSLERENSDDIKVGERVTVIGNPLGEEALRSSVTDGIVSGVRDFGWGYKVIQMSAPISPGNSGGPVFSERGKVVGIAAFSRVAGESLNFAVPSNYLSGLLEIADKAHPVQTWTASGADSIFGNGSKWSSQPLSGIWKSTCTGIFRIQDTGTNVRVVHLEALEYTYDLQWDGDVIFGTSSSDRRLIGGGTSWFLYKRVDSDHLNLWYSKVKHGETRDAALARLRSQSDQEKAPCRWIKVSD